MLNDGSHDRYLFCRISPELFSSHLLASKSNKFIMRFIRWYRMRTMWLLLLLLESCTFHWAAGIEIQRGNCTLTIIDNSPAHKTLFDVTCLIDASDNQQLDDSFLDLSRLNLIEIKDDAFGNLVNVTSLNLANNQLETLPPMIFSKMEKLIRLSLARNRFRWLNIDFRTLNNLKHLNLLDNPIDYLTNLQLLNISASTKIVMNLENLMVFDPEYPPDVELCVTNDGVVESVSLVRRNSFRNCLTLESETEDSEKDDILRLDGLNLKEFRSNWYQIPNDYYGSISLVNNEITDITPQLLNDLPNSISAVDFRGNKIKTIKANIIENRSLKTLIFESNLISTIEDSAFEKTELNTINLDTNLLKNLNFTRTLPISIRRLVISNNEISEIPQDSLSHLKMLQELQMSSNRITRLQAGTFQELSELEYLDLSTNSLKIVEAGTFNETNILRISLTSNNIREFNAENFKGLIMRELDLTGNGIRKISRDSLSIMRNSMIDILDFSRNKIDTIEEGSFANISVRVLLLNDNNLSKNSIAKGAFILCTVDNLNLNSNLFKSINGDSFYGITVHNSISLQDNLAMKRIKKDFAKYIGCLNQVDFRGTPIKLIENGAFWGFRDCLRVTITFSNAKTGIGTAVFRQP